MCRARLQMAFAWREVDVITASEDGAERLDDPDLLDRASELERVIFTRDADSLVEVQRRQKAAIFFYGVIYAHQLRVSIGTCIQDLEILAKVGEPDDYINRVEYLPL